MNYSNLSWAAAVISLAVIWPSQARSQSDSAQVYQLSEVIISANRWTENPETVGRNVTVLSSRELRNSSYYSVGELLAERQGVHMVGDGQAPGAIQSLFLRNTNSNHTVIMVDGVRISDPSTAGNTPDLSELSLARVERIEIVRGAHSTLFGSSAIGGVVNVITRDYTSAGFSGSVGSRLGTFGEGAYAQASDLNLNYSAPDGMYADFGLSHDYSNGIDATVDTLSNSPEFNPQDRDGFQKMDLSGKLGYRTDRLGIHASYRREDQSADIDGGAYSDARNARTEFNRDFVTLGGSLKLTDRIELEYRGAYSDLRRDAIDDSSLVSRSGDYDGAYSETNAEGTLLENELTARYRDEFFSAIVGVGHTGQTMSTRNYLFLRAFNYESESSLDTLGLKETIRHAFLHTELSGGLIDDALEPVSLVLGSRISNHNAFGTHLTYEVNPKIRIGSSSLLYGAITTGFNAPSLYQLYSPDRGFGNITDRGNEGLDPETSVSYELGWKQTLGSSFRFTLSLFRNRIDNVIEYVYLWDDARAVTELRGSDYRGDTYLNASQQLVNGIEVGLQARPARGLTLRGHISYADSRLRFRPDNIDSGYTGGSHVQIFESGKFIGTGQEIESLTRRPSVSATLSASWQASQQFRLNLTSRFVGQRDDIFYSSDLGPGFYGALDRLAVDGYNLTDLSVNYDLNDRISLIGKVENLFDADYREISGYRTKGRGFFLKARYRF